jgi:Protein of unknown function (DUF4232)
MSFGVFRNSLVLVGLLIFGFALTSFTVGPAVASNTAGLRPCTISSLKISATNGDGLHHGVEFIIFKNESHRACTLRGYPKIEAVLLSGKAPKNLEGMYHSSKPGSLLRSTNVEMAWAGGVNWSTGVYPSAAEQRAFVPPIISLRAKTGTASSTLNWVDGPNSGTCPAFQDIRISVARGFVTRPLGLGFAEPLCYEFDVTPIVRGPTGSMNVTSVTTTTP